MRILCLSLMLLLLTGCARQPYEGFEKVAPGLYMKLIAFNHDANSSDSCAVVHVDLNASDKKAEKQMAPVSRDLIPSWYEVRGQRFQLLERYLSHMQPGDSAIFIDLKPKIATVMDSVLIQLAYRHCYSQTDFQDVYGRWLSEREFSEAGLISGYANENGYSASIVHPDVYFRIEKLGTGKRLVYGDQIALHYRGYFLTGRLFDDSQNNAEPLQFELGLEGQVLQGLEYGLIGMLEGEVRNILVPSTLAFGEKGSSTGIVPPFTPLLFEVEAMVPDTIS